MTPHLLAGLVLTGLVGASLGVLGAGGSIIMLPVLVYVVGVDARTAVPLSLAIVGATSLVSAAVRTGNHEIRWDAALLFGGAALAGAFLGSALTSLVADAVLLLLFGLLLLVVGLRMWRMPPVDDHEAAPRPRRPALMVGGGLAVGVLTGFLGVGGGFLIVPALMAVGGLPIRHAVSTSLVIIAMSSAAGLIGHLVRGAVVPLGMAAGLTLAAAVGMFVGLRGARRASNRQLRRGFAAFVLAVGGALVAVNAAALLR